MEIVWINKKNVGWVDEDGEARTSEYIAPAAIVTSYRYIDEPPYDEVSITGDITLVEDVSPEEEVALKEYIEEYFKQNWWEFDPTLITK